MARVSKQWFWIPEATQHETTAHLWLLPGNSGKNSCTKRLTPSNRLNWQTSRPGRQTQRRISAARLAIVQASYHDHFSEPTYVWVLNAIIYQPAIRPGWTRPRFFRHFFLTACSEQASMEWWIEQSLAATTELPASFLQSLTVLLRHWWKQWVRKPAPSFPESFGMVTRRPLKFLRQLTLIAETVYLASLTTYPAANFWMPACWTVVHFAMHSKSWPRIST